MNQTLLEFSFEAGKLVSQQNLSADNAKNIGAYKKPFERFCHLKSEFATF